MGKPAAVPKRGLAPPLKILCGCRIWSIAPIAPGYRPASSADASDGAAIGGEEGGGVEASGSRSGSTRPVVEPSAPWRPRADFEAHSAVEDGPPTEVIEAPSWRREVAGAAQATPQPQGAASQLAGGARHARSGTGAPPWRIVAICLADPDKDLLLMHSIDYHAVPKGDNPLRTRTRTRRTTSTRKTELGALCAAHKEAVEEGLGRNTPGGETQPPHAQRRHNHCPSARG